MNFNTTRRLLCFFICFSFYLSVSAQNEGNIWYFGSYAGIDFNSGSPVVLTNSAMYAGKGCASIADINGNLLFYTNGVTIWNKNHAVMNNGSGLLGSTSSTQSGVIVPLPGSNHIYYVFTVTNTANSDGLRYSIVDMSLSGGLGSITTKNVLLFTPSCEKITAVKHSNNQGTWVITHPWNSNAFYTYYIDNNGLNLSINNPVISYTGSFQQGDLRNTYGYMKASPDGSMLVLANFTFCEIFRFDNNTGIVSNPIRLKYQGNDFFGNGVEFSPNGRLLYLSVAIPSTYSNVVQLNVSNYSGPSINSSFRFLYSYNVLITNKTTQALQIAPDGKIYIAKTLSGLYSYLDVINSPNDTGTNANYITDGLYLHLKSNEYSVCGLPTFIQSYFFFPDFKVNNFCLGDSTKFTLTASINNIDSVKWNFGNPSSGTKNTSKLFNLKHKFTDTGSYNVSVIIYHSSMSDTFKKSITITYYSPASFTTWDTSQCLKGNIFTFINTSSKIHGPITFIWDFGDTINAYDTLAVTHSYKYDKIYKAKLISTTLYGCTDTFTKQIVVRPNPVAFFSVNNASQCLKANNFIFTNKSKINKNTPLTYKWYFGDGDSNNKTNVNHSYKIVDSFKISLIATSNTGCKDTFNSLAVICPQASPAFTINDSAQCSKWNHFVFTNNTLNPPNGICNYEWLFGDTTTDTAKNTTHHYSDSGTYITKLITFTNYGCKDTLAKTIIVQPMPDTTITVSNLKECLKNNAFTFTGSPSAKSYLWNFGDGNYDSNRVVVHNYLSAGTFNVKLIISNDFGCTDTGFKNIVVLISPVSIFTVNDSVQCLNGNHFKFINKGSLHSLSGYWLWLAGDGFSSLSKDSVSHTYSLSDTFTVKLIGVNQYFCKDTAYKTIIVYPSPKADFTVSDSVRCLNGNIFSFNNKGSFQSSNGQWLWNFGDNITDTNKSTVHTYASANTFKVKLIAENQYGCKDSMQKNITVNASPSASFTIADSVQCFNGNNFVFLNTGILQLPGSWNWDLGDGTISTLKNPPDHSFSMADSFLIKLTATNQFNCKDSVEKTAVVLPSPDAAFSVNDSIQCLKNNRFIFTMKNKQLTSNFKWLLGDGNSSSFNDSVIHTYLTQGTFNTRLTITNSFNCKDSFIKTVVVNPSPDATFIISDSIQCMNKNQFVFSTIKTQPDDSFTWNLGDGTITNVKNLISHSYTTFSIFNVKLMIENKFNCKDTFQKTAIVYASPDATFTINNSSQCLKGNLFSFTSKNQPVSSNFDWEFGDINTSTIANPAHTYINPGNFNVQLIITTKDNCEDTTSQIIIVKPNPVTPVASNSSPVCVNKTISFYVFSTPNSSFQWKADNGFTSNLQNPLIKNAGLRDSGIYYVRAFLNGCKSDSAITHVIIYPLPVVSIGKDNTICEGDHVVLDPGYFASYLWQDNSTKRIFTVNKPGTYSVVVSNSYGCKDSDEVIFKEKCPPRIFIPDAFTPNGDGHNDKFEIITSDLMHFEIRIFDRWGENIFHSTDPSISWDGTYKGSDCPIGTYTYMIYTTDNDAIIRNFQGIVNLLR